MQLDSQGGDLSPHISQTFYSSGTNTEVYNQKDKYTIPFIVILCSYENEKRFKLRYHI